MKRKLLACVLVLCCFGCSRTKYKPAAVEYLKTQLAKGAFIDTVKFLKPDTIFTSFYDSREYVDLKYSRDSLISENKPAEAAKVSAVLDSKIKTFSKKVIGYDVSLIYKGKNKQGAIKTDTCRFTFGADFKVVKDVNGIDL
ncbi:hypothetical protein [Mucilaginibacter sp.]|uniref:hypothetical protein n=1 Tax=Mucilaginibacter sp. TaxID=1882438 RepID=UPI003D128147